MSSRLIPTKDTTRQKQTKWFNGICYLHDLFCDCCHPLEHTVQAIFEKEPQLQLSSTEKTFIKKCLSGEETTTTQDDGDVIEPGDLDALFAQDFDERDIG